jgi:hypothetical protein
MMSLWTPVYGDLDSVRFGFKRIVFANHPDLVEEVLSSSKSPIHQTLPASSNQEKPGARAREERISAHRKLMVGFTERMLESWVAGQTRDIQYDIIMIISKNVAKTSFDAEIFGEPAHASATTERLMRCFVARARTLVDPPDQLPTLPNL